MQTAPRDSGSQASPQRRAARPPSIAPSISSVLSDATTITAPSHEQRGFKSREEYLAALNEFAESKLYMPTGGHTLHGWYGGKTMDDYKNRPGLRDGKKKRRSGEMRGEAVSAGARRATMAVVPETADESSRNQLPEAGGQSSVLAANDSEKQGRLRRLSRVFSSGSGRNASVA